MHLGQKGFKTMKTQSLLVQIQDFSMELFFPAPLALDNVMMDIPSNHILDLANDGNLIEVSTTALVIRANAHVPKP
jgi:hypothetical protein